MAVALVIVFQVLAELTVMLNYAMALVFATPLALLLAHIGAQTSTTVLVRDRMLDTLLGVVVALAAALLIPNRRLAIVVRRSRSALEASLDRTRAIPDDAPMAERAGAARQTATRIYALRESYDAAIGEPWPEDLPAEEIVRLESDGHARPRPPHPLTGRVRRRLHAGRARLRAPAPMFGGKSTDSGISASGGGKEARSTITAMTFFLVIAAIAVILFLRNGRRPLAGSGPAAEDRDPPASSSTCSPSAPQAEPLTHKPLTTRPATPPSTTRASRPGRARPERAHRQRARARG